MVAELIAAAVVGGAGVPALSLKPCTLQGSVRARCGTLAVPEDRRQPSGRKIRVFVGVVRAVQPRPRRPPIFWLSGGPGGAAASDDARFASTTFLGANLTRDIVLVDQRGVGRSAPLFCPQPQGVASEEEAVAYVQSCLRTAGRDPRLYATDPAMDDVDAVRRALGYPKIVLYGGSYGATAAQVYLARHSAHVSAAVLDSGTLLDVPIWERMALSTQGAFDALVARCAADRVCRVIFPDPAADLRLVLSRLRTKPLEVPLESGTVVFGVGDAQSMLRFLLRVPEWAASVPLILHRAAAGDLSGLVDPWLAAIADELKSSVKLMYWGIRCGEGWSRDDPAEVKRLGAATSFLEASLEEAQEQAFICGQLGTPVPAPDTGVVPRVRTPVLFLVGGMDPQDPLPNVAEAPRSLPNAQILVVPGAGHGAVQYGCMPQVATRFFSTHRLNAKDRTCAASVQPPPFEIAAVRRLRRPGAGRRLADLLDRRAGPGH
jgi:pimeloyl-ACP methyl ester carboxylesterase